MGAGVRTAANGSGAPLSFGEIPVTAANEAAIRQTFESAGIEFIDENETGEGIRFRKPKRATRK
jgi:hypothetical protein